VNDELATASDASLAVGVARWRPEALAEVYRRNAGAVFGLAKRLLVEEALAEELTQEVFVSFWQRPERYDPARGSLRAFLLAVAHGRAVDMLRSETSRRAREQRARAVAGAGYDLEQEVVELVANERVREALDKLPETERSAIELAYFGGHTYREVATIQNEPEGTVKSRIRSGLRRMERELAHLSEGTNR
jgi:RNA polymerase sigma-70 factor (ECF subfamily)